MEETTSAEWAPAGEPAATTRYGCHSCSELKGRAEELFAVRPASYGETKVAIVVYVDAAGPSAASNVSVFERSRDLFEPLTS